MIINESNVLSVLKNNYENSLFLQNLVLIKKIKFKVKCTLEVIFRQQKIRLNGFLYVLGKSKLY